MRVLRRSLILMVAVGLLTLGQPGAEATGVSRGFATSQVVHAARSEVSATVGMDADLGALWAMVVVDGRIVAKRSNDGGMTWDKTASPGKGDSAVFVGSETQAGVLIGRGGTVLYRGNPTAWNAAQRVSRFACSSYFPGYHRDEPLGAFVVECQQGRPARIVYVPDATMGVAAGRSGVGRLPGDPPATVGFMTSSGTDLSSAVDEPHGEWKFVVGAYASFDQSVWRQSVSGVFMYSTVDDGATWQRGIVAHTSDEVGTVRVNADVDGAHLVYSTARDGRATIWHRICRDANDCDGPTRVLGGPGWVLEDIAVKDGIVLVGLSRSGSLFRIASIDGGETWDGPYKIEGYLGAADQWRMWPTEDAVHSVYRTERNGVWRVYYSSAPW